MLKPFTFGFRELLTALGTLGNLLCKLIVHRFNVHIPQALGGKLFGVMGHRQHGQLLVPTSQTLARADLEPGQPKISGSG